MIRETAIGFVNEKYQVQLKDLKSGLPRWIYRCLLHHNTGSFKWYKATLGKNDELNFWFRYILNKMLELFIFLPIIDRYIRFQKLLKRIMI